LAGVLSKEKATPLLKQLNIDPKLRAENLRLEDYINGYIDDCVDVICKKHKLKKINLLGICQGGTFCLCYTALHQEKVCNLITTVTPVDFYTKKK